MTAYIRKAKWMHVFIPLVVLTLYCVSLSWFLSWLLPEYGTNVNAAFVDGAWKFSLLAAGLYLVFLALFKLYRILEPYIVVQDHKEKKPTLKTKKGNRLAFKNRLAFGNRIEKFDFILVLLPLTPVVQYILNNQDILSPLGSLCVFAVFVVFSVLFIIVVPTLLGAVGSTKTLMILGLTFTFTITNMASLSVELHWLERGDLLTQLLLLSAVFLVGWILYNLIGRKFLYFLVAGFFIAGSATQLASQGRAETPLPIANNRLVELVGSRKPLSTPSIYLLVYDSYVTNETMLGYGIDNSAQEKYLETLGFELYPHTYSVGSSTLSSMSRTLNTSTEFYGNPRRGVSGDGVVQNLLERSGYETHGIFSGGYFFEGIGSSYDFSFPEAPSSPELMMKAIFMGEFRSDIEFGGEVLRQQAIEYWLSIFESVPDQPRFVYMHQYVPGHVNVVACRPNETEIYETQLGWANSEMKLDIETITQNDPDAIVVVAGDHGPHLTRCAATTRPNDISEVSRFHIQDNLGAFLAIRWPTEDFSEYDDITVLQDVFPAIFAYLFQDDRLLEAKVEPMTLDNAGISGAWVENGIIHVGINDGEPLFIGQ